MEIFFKEVQKICWILLILYGLIISGVYLFNSIKYLILFFNNKNNKKYFIEGFIGYSVLLLSEFWVMIYIFEKIGVVSIFIMRVLLSYGADYVLDHYNNKIDKTMEDKYGNKF